jgi:hypothetical protein
MGGAPCFACTLQRGVNMFPGILRSGPILSRGLVRAVTAVCALVYVGVFLNASAFLPDFIFRDAEKIQAQMDGSSTYDGTSFDAVGKFYALFGSTLLNALIIVVGILFIREMIKNANRLGLLIIGLLLCAPCIFFNLFVASKDTIVVMMSLVIVGLARGKRPWLATATALVVYTFYAVAVRRYFLLIVAVAGGLFVFRGIRWRWKITLLLAVLIGLFLLPNVAYVALLQPRDMAVDYLVYQSPYGARTSFYNPLPPDSFVAFSIDYLYATVRLNFAPLFSLGAKELALQLFVYIAVWPVLRRSSNPDRRLTRETFACLVLGHVCVSMLFEPDLGSYIRHLSSVALFSMSLITAWGAERAPRRRTSPTGWIRTGRG